jgi:hypothetical protein
MKTPAQRHFERVMAARTAAAAAPGDSMAGASRYELMLAKLATDRRRLKEVQSVARKADVKREVLPDYAAYVDGVLEAGRGAQDDVLMTVMIWRIDAADYAGALAIARYALEHGLSMPDQYARPTPAALAEEFADAALAASRDGRAFDVAVLDEVLALTQDADMHDPVRAKLYKAIGLARVPRPVLDGAILAGDDIAPTKLAIDSLHLALQYDAGSGVKTLVSRLEKALGKATGTDAGGQ